MEITKTIECKCPACGHKLDSSVSTDDTKPASGDITICLYCGHICAYDDNLQLRELTDEEAVDIAGDPDVLAAVKLTSTLREMLNEENNNGKE